MLSLFISKSFIKPFSHSTPHFIFYLLLPLFYFQHTLGRWSRHMTTWSPGLFKVFNGGVVDFSSPSPHTHPILYTHISHTHSHSCTAVRVGGALPWWETEWERGRGRLSYCDWVQRESHWTVGKALSPFTRCGQLCAMAVCVQWASHLIEGYTQAGSSDMQGRAGKAPKREMVIESPQQYKSLAEIEAEVEAGSQVAAVSVDCAMFYIRRGPVFLKSALILGVSCWKEPMWSHCLTKFFIA